MSLYKIKIREVATGVEVETLENVDPKYADSQRFFYEDGNASCDCNRKLMFGYAQGITFSDEETPCGSGKFKVKIVDDTGRIVYDELEA